MFTGLVRTMGRLQRWRAGVWVRGDLRALGPLALGDSIAVDGVCLTVSRLLGDGFQADVSEETLSRTTLAPKADGGDWVNLEPALRLSDRLGGHLVSGHVDGQGKILAIQRQPASWHLEVGCDPKHHGHYLCEKASIALDGISLTLAGCDDDGGRFWVAVIPHTWITTTLQYRQVGDLLNLEIDLLAKYTERLLDFRGQGGRSGAPGPNPGPDGEATPSLPISAAWLRSQGW
ncbi:MAG: riboflavin synthase [Cyanobacteria bacterium]|nr:riboflavin synthase [Cyanobacteriota bacterium]